MEKTNIFMRFFIMFFVLLFPFLMFVTFFRFTGQNYTLFGFYDFTSVLSLTATLDLQKDINVLVTHLKDLEDINRDFDLFFTLNDWEQNIITESGLGSIPIIGEIARIVAVIQMATISMNSTILYLVRGIRAFLSSLHLVIMIVLDFVPFLVSFLTSFISCFTAETSNVFGQVHVVSNMDFSEHLDWFDSLVS